YMTSPWLHYEAYDIKFVNNIIHHTEGAGFGVNGGYNILLAYNTLYHVGTRSHGLEVVFGGRSCDGDTNAATTCSANLARGGWGTTTLHTDGEPIPNRNVFIYNNVLYNPPGVQSQWQHLSIAGPRTPSAGSNIPSPSRSDTNLQIKGNIIWNGDVALSLGLGSDQGCLPSNPTCNEAQLRADNTINTLVPQLTNPASGNFRPLLGGNMMSLVGVSIPDFPSGDLPAIPGAASGNVDNSVTRDFGNSPRQNGMPGAYAGASDSATVTPRSVTSTSTSTIRPTLTMSRTSTATRSATATPTATLTHTRTATRTPSHTGTPTQTRTATRTHTNTATHTMSRTPTNTRTATLTFTASKTFTPSNTGTATRTRTNTATPTNSRTSSITWTASTTLTPSPTRTATSSRTPTRTQTATRTRTATATVTITYTPGVLDSMPVIPVIDAPLKSRLRAIYLNGQTLGNRAGVFAKAGDSITSSGSFLMDIGCGSENLAAYSGLATTIAYFRSTAFVPASAYGSGWCEVSNSFNAYSVSADSGWSADYAL
ncbi:MAG: hypothetical protein ACKO83_03640, partial [Roseiflexaceae bacterium]